MSLRLIHVPTYIAHSWDPPPPAPPLEVPSRKHIRQGVGSGGGRCGRVSASLQGPVRATTQMSARRSASTQPFPHSPKTPFQKNSLKVSESLSLVSPPRLRKGCAHTDTEFPPRVCPASSGDSGVCFFPPRSGASVGPNHNFPKPGELVVVYCSVWGGGLPFTMEGTSGSKEPSMV